MGPNLVCLWLVALMSAQDVRVVDLEGKPVPGASVTIAAGLVHLRLAEDFERWSAVKRVEATTDEQGICRAAGLPEGARLTVFAREGTRAGLAELEPGAGDELALVLFPTGTLVGKATGKRSLRGYTLQAVGPRGFETKKLELEDEEWTLEDLPLGEVELEVRLGNWLALRKTVAVTAGKPVKVPALKVPSEFLHGADPLVDARRVKLLDAAKKPLTGVKMAWSAPWMDGWMPSDDKAEIPLVDGGVAIGPPPFVLRLASIGIDQEKKYLGKFLGVERGTALVQALAALEPLDVTVTRGGKSVAAFQLHAVSGGSEPRVWSAKLEGASARLAAPPGALRLIVGTADGKLHAEELMHAAGRAEHVVALPD